MKLSDELIWRGYLNQRTFDDVSLLDGEPLTFYWGVDPSAPSMTIGNLVAALMVRQLIEHGHKAILLVGGATGMIGDPDGKKQERDLLTLEQIDANKKAIAKQYGRIFAGQDFKIVDNYDWFKDLGYLDFLRIVGKKAPMSQLLDRDFIKSRLGEAGEGISYAEFSYSLIQGYDFLHLFREQGVTLQVAGADQWGNSVMGVQLIKRLDGGEAHVLTTPLIVNPATGQKFGKSEGGAVWLDPDMTSPYKFYQFWLNIADDFAKDLLPKYTLLSKEAVDQVIADHDAAPQRRGLQRRLAREVTGLVHGQATVESIEKASAILFSDEPSDGLDDEAVKMLSSELPTAPAGDSAVEALKTAGIVKGSNEARRFIESGAVKLNGRKLVADQPVAARDLLKLGKNNFLLITG